MTERMFMFQHEKERLEQLRREAAEREALEERERLEQSARAERLQREGERLARRKEYEHECIEAEKLRLEKNSELLPEIGSKAAFLALPLELRSKYYGAFGEDYLVELHSRSQCGLSLLDWRKLVKAQPLPNGIFNPPSPYEETAEL